MKKTIFGIIAIIVLGFAGHSFLPWWSIVAVAAIVGIFIGKSGLQSFLFGFVAVLLLWGIYAWQLDTANVSILSSRIGNLFGGLNPFSLILLTGLLGGVLGGLGAMTGALGRQVFEKQV